MGEPKRCLRHNLIQFQEVEKLSSDMLPSCREVLEVYFYWRRKMKKTPRESSRIAVRQCMQFWKFAELETQQEIRAISKLERLLGEYSKLIKTASRQDDHTIAKRKDFAMQVEKIFDIAHKNVAEVASHSALEFLTDQRDSKRKNSFGTQFTADCDNHQNEGTKRSGTTKENPDILPMNYADFLWFSDENVKDLLEEDDNSGDEDFVLNAKCSVPKKMKVIDFETSCALDRGRVSIRDSARILSAFIQNLGYSLEEISMSRETFRRARKNHRKSAVHSLRENFELENDDRLFVHWDGKQLPDLDNKYKVVDRLPILISGDIEKLIGISKIERGTGEEQAKAVVKALRYWNVQNNVCGMVFDTTSANTGVINGACVNIENLLGRSLLHCACRHHIYELSLKTAYEKCLGGTSGPEVLLFKRFQTSWANLNKKEYSPGMQNEYICKKLNDQKEDILCFIREQLQKNIIRHDYRELLELIRIFLEESVEEFSFKALGPIHHARWMSKAIYSLKIFLFRNQFNLTTYELKGLSDFCIFIVLVFIKAWFTATDARSAPRNDLLFLRRLLDFHSINAKLVDAVYKQIEEKHLWYLGEELIGLSFFDDGVDLDIKRRMTEAISTCPGNDKYSHNKRLDPAEKENIRSLSLDHFVTTQTMEFFNKLRLSTSFLEYDPETWKSRDDYQENLRIVLNLQVVNDKAERGVALIKEYNRLLTKDENDFQALMQIVSEYREKVKDCNKKTLEIGLSKFIFSES